MAYQVNRTDGKFIVDIIDGGFNDTATSLTLVGKNYGPYAQKIAENFIKLLENFSNSTEPISALQGQLWFDRNSNTIRVFSQNVLGSGNVWRALGSTVSSTAPATIYTGDTWFSTVTQQLFVRRSDGSDVLIGPTSSSTVANTELRAETILDTSLISHKILGFYIDNVRTFIINRDGNFFTTVNGFLEIKNGLNPNTSISNNRFNGTVSNSLLLDNKSPNDFLQKDINETTSGNLVIGSTSTNGGNLSIGSSTAGNLQIIRSNDNYGWLVNSRLNGGWRIIGNVGGTQTNLAIFDTNKVGLFTNSPVTTLDVNGSFKTKFTDVGSTGAAVTVDALTAGSQELNLTTNTTITISNFSTPGQTLRLILKSTASKTITWSTSPAIVWPNSVASPNFAAGTAKIAAINLLRTQSSILATFVTY